MDWLISLPTFVQLALTLVVLLPVAGAVAVVMLWLIDAAASIRVSLQRESGAGERAE